MGKNKIIWVGVIMMAILIFGYLYFWNEKQNKPIVCTQEAKACLDGSSVSRIGPKCEFALCPEEKEGIIIISPKPNDIITSPLKIEGQAKGFWYFEAQFKAELYDEKQNFLGQTILKAQKDWMSEEFIPFSGELFFTQPTIQNGVLRFLSDNPSGLSQKQKIFELPVQFQLSQHQSQLQKVLLYYYNPEKDKDENGNIKCSEDGLVAIARDIPITKTPIQDTIKLLLQGKENLTQDDIKNGITTEFPLEGFILKEASLNKEGTLTLKFSDPMNKTSGGSCRVKILWTQIEKTAKQFPAVKKVQFLPEELFQP